ncbi:MAG: YceI family protein, partial [Chitinophagaceae bacterium]
MPLKSLYAAVAITAAIATSSFSPSTNETNPVKILPGQFFNVPRDVTKWTVDKAHSNVKFSVTHMVVSEVEGTFKIFDGSMEHSKPDFSDAK